MAAGARPVRIRGDGRNSSQLRSLMCTRGLLDRAHGSARWSQGETTVLAAVYGPKSVSGKKENPERATLEIVWKCKSGLASNTEKEAEFVIRRTLEHIVLASLNPNTGISVILQVIEDDGAILACALNAACAALIDAGIPLQGLIAAVSCAVTADEVLLDPTKGEEDKCAHVCLVFLSRPKSVKAELPVAIDGEPAEDAMLTCLTRGAMSVDEYLSCLERGRAATRKISDFSRASLEQCQRMPEMVNPLS